MRYLARPAGEEAPAQRGVLELSPATMQRLQSLRLPQRAAGVEAPPLAVSDEIIAALVATGRPAARPFHSLGLRRTHACKSTFGF